MFVHILDFVCPLGPDLRRWIVHQIEKNMLVVNQCAAEFSEGGLVSHQVREDGILGVGDDFLLEVSQSRFQCQQPVQEAVGMRAVVGKVGPQNRVGLRLPGGQQGFSPVVISRVAG